MSARQQQILSYFGSRGQATSSELAFETGAPEASIRRDIQALRRAGYNISFASPNGVYRLGPSN